MVSENISPHEMEIYIDEAQDEAARRQKIEEQHRVNQDHKSGEEPDLNPPA